MAKLGIRDRVEVPRFAIRYGVAGISTIANIMRNTNEEASAARISSRCCRRQLILPPAQAPRTDRSWAKRAAARALAVCVTGTSLTGAVLSKCIAGAPDAPPAAISPVGSGFAGLGMPPGATPLPHGYLRVRGSQITEQGGGPVRLACVGYFAPKNVGQDIPAMAAAGFNCVRYPWYNATLADDLPVMDEIVKAAGMAGLKVIFDHHGDETPSAANSYLPYPCNGVNYEGPSLILGVFASRFQTRGSGTVPGGSSVAKAGFTVVLSGLRNRLASAAFTSSR
jgi:hypothetical protein